MICKITSLHHTLCTSSLRARLSDRGGELPSLDFGGEGNFINVAQFGRAGMDADVRING